MIAYRPEIDGLRAVAVLLVILFHAGFPFLPGGYVGVDVFFVISGYLITSIIIKEQTAGHFSLLSFYERRMRRILPALFCVVVFCYPFAWGVLSPLQFRDFSQSVVAVMMFASNVLFWQKTDYFTADVDDKPLLHTWSLGVEEQYYLFFPLFMMVMWRMGLGRIMISLCCISIISFMLCEYVVRVDAASAFYLLPMRAWELLIGALCAVYHFKWGRIPNAYLATCGVFMVCGAGVMLDDFTPFPSFYALLPVVGAALVLLYAAPENLCGRILGMKGIVGMGLLSYSAYLWHQPLFAFMRVYLADEPSLMIMMLLCGMTFALSYLSWRFVEQPFRARQGRAPRVRTRYVVMLAVLCSVGFMALGMAGHFKIFKPQENKLRAQIEEEFQELGAQRLALLRAGECHFNERGRYKIFADFAAQWNCVPSHTGDQDLKPIPVAVFGDSHAADKALALRLNGYNPMQIGSMDCSIVPSLQDAHCRQITNIFVQHLKDEHITEIWLANLFSVQELTPVKMREAMDFWTSLGKKVVIFSPMPSFERIRGKLYWARLKEAAAEAEAAIHPDLTSHERFFKPDLQDAMKNYDVRIINTKEHFCAVTDGACALIVNGEMLMVDESHLSVAGAQKFGGRMYPIALEGALKMKEISYIHAEGYAAGEMKHGPIALIDDRVPIIVVAPGHDPLFEKTMSNTQGDCARCAGGDVLRCRRGRQALKDQAAHVVTLGEIAPFVALILYTIPMQLLAYHVAYIKGTDLDHHSRKLTKSLTVQLL